MRTELGQLGEQETTDTGDGGAEHLELIRQLIVRFGAYAETLFDYHDFGFSREAVRDHIANVEAEIRRIQEGGTEGFLEIPAGVLREEFRSAWNSKKNLRYAAGALLMSSGVRTLVGPENRLRAIRLKMMYEVFLDTVDDLIDSDAYCFSDAFDLMRHCLDSLTAPSFDERFFQEELAARLAPDQRRMTDFLTCLAGAVRHGIWGSPQGRSLIRELARFQENWICGEAYTMFQKDPTVDIRAFLAAASRMPAPDAELNPWERASAWISHTAALALLDLCFADRPIAGETLEETLAGWFYFDATITLMNHMIDLRRDLDDGIANIFLIARGGEEVLNLRTVRGFRPVLTMDDYDAFLSRTAEFALRSLEHAWRSREDPDLFHPFLAVMAPVVMYTDETGIREDVLHAYLRMLAPAMRDALARGRTPVPTIPPGTRSGRTPSARTASL